VVAATGAALDDQAAQVLAETAAGVVEVETTAAGVEDQTPQALLLEAATDLLVVVEVLLHTPQVAELEELVTLAGVVVVVVAQALHEAGVVLVTFTGVVVVVVLTVVVELVQASQSPDEVATAAAEAAPAKAAAVMKDFILRVGFISVLLNE